MGNWDHTPKLGPRPLPLPAPWRCPAARLFPMSRLPNALAAVPVALDVSAVAASQAEAALITGGYGGLGLQLATFLAACGYPRLVLVGRRPPGEEAVRVIRELEARHGVVVTCETADVADRSQVQKLLERTAQPLAVFHAAGVLLSSGLAWLAVLLHGPCRIALLWRVVI